MRRPPQRRGVDALLMAVGPLALPLNENPFPPLPAVRSALIRSIVAANRYPAIVAGLNLNRLQAGQIAAC
jgi:histidinol-phosphate aminotransferase